MDYHSFFVVYFRFLNVLSPSISVMYSNPVSIRFIASLVVLAVLHVYSSDSVRNIDASMLIYFIVLLISLCPKIFFTLIMSLVLWYSIVAFQCLNVCSLIWFILGLESLSAVLFLSAS